MTEQAVEIRASFEVFAFSCWLKLRSTWTIEKTESFAGKLNIISLLKGIWLVILDVAIRWILIRRNILS